MDNDFGHQLREYRQRVGLSQNEVGRRAGINPGTINRFEAGEREPTGREQVEALSTALELSPLEQDGLLVLAAAHLLPESVRRLVNADPVVHLVADVLTDESIPTPERDDFRLQIMLAARRWRPSAAIGVPSTAPVAR